MNRLRDLQVIKEKLVMITSNIKHVLLQILNLLGLAPLRHVIALQNSNGELRDQCIALQNSNVDLREQYIGLQNSNAKKKQLGIEWAKDLRLIKKKIQISDDEAVERIIQKYKVSGKSSIREKVYYAKILLSAGRAKESYEILEPIANQLGNDPDKKALEESYWLSQTEFKAEKFKASAAAHHVLKLPNISTILDVGSGGGEQARFFADAGKKVTCIDLGRSVYYKENELNSVNNNVHENIDLIIADIQKWDSSQKYDLVWASHVLEHQKNTNLFLEKLLSVVSDEGYLAITVPPLKHTIVGGHLTLWNAGLLLYNIVMAGNDCSEAVIMNYGYNISVIVPRRKIMLPELDFDSGDIDRLASFFPDGCKENFDGRMRKRFPNKLPAGNT